MATETKHVLVAIGLCLGGGLLAAASPSIGSLHVRDAASAATVAPASHVTSVFALAESVQWAKMDIEPAWPSF